MSLDLLIFDCDGVLLDSEGPYDRIISETLGEFGIHLSSEETSGLFRGVATLGMNQIFKDRGWNLDHRFWDRVDSRFREAIHMVDAIDGIVPVLQHLADHNIATCICTNTENQVRLDRKLTQAKLDRWFAADHCWTIERVDHPKPAPDMHLAAAAFFGVDPTRAVVLEDSVSGARAARAAGIDVWGFTQVAVDKEGDCQRLLAAGCSEVLPNHRALLALLQQG